MSPRSWRRPALELAAVGAAGLAGLYVGKTRGVPFVRRADVFAIGIYHGPDPLRLAPHPAVTNPVLTAADVSDVPASFVADPFMVRDGDTWQMFFEVLNARTNRGEIGLASSTDGLRWQYHQIVLREPFHLSYPFVFRWSGAYYMVPESYESYQVRLYRAARFPDSWTYVSTLLSGIFYDSTLFEHAGRWWMFTAGRDDVLRLFQAEAPIGPWREHPDSPLIVGDPHRARPGGRVVAHAGRLIRLAQDDMPYYGNQLRAFAIDTLTPAAYHDHEVEASPILVGSGGGWNARGMHHADPHELGPENWLACVDGFRRGLRFAGRW